MNDKELYILTQELSKRFYKCPECNAFLMITGDYCGDMALVCFECKYYERVKVNKIKQRLGELDSVGSIKQVEDFYLKKLLKLVKSIKVNSKYDMDYIDINAEIILTEALKILGLKKLANAFIWATSVSYDKFERYKFKPNIEMIEFNCRFIDNKEDKNGI